MSEEINTDWLNKKINSMFEEYSRSKKNGKPIEVSIRNKKADEVIEIYFKEHEQLPEANYIDRLATYILLDELSDNNNDKVQKVEYNILSNDQEKRRRVNEILLPDIFYNTQEAFGKGTSVRLMGSDEVYFHEHQYLFNAVTEEIKEIEADILFFNSCHEEKVSVLDSFIVYQVIFNDKTLRSLEGELNLKRTAITDRYNKTMEILRKSKFLYDI